MPAGACILKSSAIHVHACMPDATQMFQHTHWCRLDHVINFGCAAGTLTCDSKGYASLSAFSLAAMRLVTPGRQSSCGWWDVTYKGIKFGKLREQAAQQAGAANGEEGGSPGNIKPRYKSSPAPANNQTPPPPAA